MAPSPANLQQGCIIAKKKFASRVRGGLITSQMLEENLSWVGYNFSLVPRTYHEFGVKPPFGARPDTSGRECIDFLHTAPNRITM